MSFIPQKALHFFQFPETMFVSRSVEKESCTQIVLWPLTLQGSIIILSIFLYYSFLSTSTVFISGYNTSVIVSLFCDLDKFWIESRSISLTQMINAFSLSLLAKRFLFSIVFSDGKIHLKPFSYIHSLILKKGTGTLQT